MDLNWYGNNLDALNDCLGEVGEPTQIIVRFAPMLEQTLGDYGIRIIRVMQRAAEENPNLRVLRSKPGFKQSFARTAHTVLQSGRRSPFPTWRE